MGGVRGRETWESELSGKNIRKIWIVTGLRRSLSSIFSLEQDKLQGQARPLRFLSDLGALQEWSLHNLLGLDCPFCEDTSLQEPELLTVPTCPAIQCDFSFRCQGLLPPAKTAGRHKYCTLVLVFHVLFIFSAVPKQIW